MDYCQHYRRVAWSHRPDSICLFTRLRCKQWSCDYCARKNQQIWRAFLSGQLPIVADNWWFVTLTAHSRMRSQDASYKNLQHGIDVIMKRVRRIWKNVNYVRVFEKHPTSDALHAHLIVSNLTPFVVPGCNKNLQPTFLGVLLRKGHTGVWSLRTWLKKAAQECKIGYQAEVEFVRNEYAVHYVCKYLSKISQQITVKNLRHVSTSHRIGSPDTSSPERWISGEFITTMSLYSDETLHDVNTLDRISYEELRTLGVYPQKTECYD